VEHRAAVENRWNNLERELSSLIRKAVKELMLSEKKPRLPKRRRNPGCSAAVEQATQVDGTVEWLIPSALIKKSARIELLSIDAWDALLDAVYPRLNHLCQG
jgi:hypothetical protein